MWVRVVIVSYNAGDYLDRVVDGLAKQTAADFEAVIVDNASQDGSIERLVLPDGRFRIIRADRNLGFAAGCNLGASGGSTPWLAMLNPDAVPKPDWLEALKAATQRHSEAVAFGSTQLDAANEALLDGAGDNFAIFGFAWRGGYGADANIVSGDIRVFAPCGAAALYRRDVFEATAGFNENFFCYLEDVDLGFRLRLAGHDVVQVAAARVSHAGSITTGAHSPFTVYHSARNGIFLLVRCMPLVLLTVVLPLHMLSQLYVTVSRRRLMSPKARLAGVKDGFKALPRLLRERRQIQRQRRLSTAAVARLVAWNPLHLWRRQIVALPLIRPSLADGGDVSANAAVSREVMSSNRGDKHTDKSRMNARR
jgi:N-acetylglucosaminyl-diphospho-decaprenol L-rhamnosyltransferase